MICLNLCIVSVVYICHLKRTGLQFFTQSLVGSLYRNLTVLILTYYQYSEN